MNLNTSDFHSHKLSLCRPIRVFKQLILLGHHFTISRDLEAQGFKGNVKNVMERAFLKRCVRSSVVRFISGIESKTFRAIVI